MTASQEIWNRLWNEQLRLAEGGSTDAALKHCTAMHAWVFEHCGPYHPSSIRCLLQMGRLESARKNYSAALGFFIEARQKIEAALDEEHPLWGEVYVGMADLYTAQHLHREAEPFYRKTLRIRELNGIEGDLPQVELLLRIGGACLSQRKFAPAREVLNHALTLAAEVDAPPELLIRLYSDLGFSFFDDLQFERCVSYFEEALLLLSRGDFVDTELEVKVIRAQLLAFLHQGRLVESQYHLKLLIQFLESQPQGQAMIIDTLETMILQLDPEAGPTEMLYLELLDAVERLHGKGLEYAASAELTAEFYCLQQRFSDARGLLEEASAIFRKAGAAGADLAGALHNLGLTLFSLGEHESAAEVLEEALELRREVLGVEHPETARTLLAVAALRQQEDQLDEAQRLASEAAMVRQEGRGAEQIARRARQTLAELKEAASLRNRRGATSIGEASDLDLSGMEAGAAPDLRAVSSLFSTALRSMRDGSFAEAARLFEQTLSILEAAHGPEHQDLIPVLDHTGAVYYQLGLKDKAFELKRRADKLRAQL